MLNYLKSLLIKKAKVKKLIDIERTKRLPDLFYLYRLKKINLLFKDKIYKVFKDKNNKLLQNIEKSKDNRKIRG